MKFFEFHFNPKSKERDTIFDTFCFSPETRAEENLGYLYLIGELKNVLPKNKELLANLAEIIKREYYKFPEKEASESFKESLEKANQFLAQEVRRENASWLGNLNFVALILTSDFLINFSKTGNLKVLLLRRGEVFNIGENLKFNGSPAKVFPNVVEGKLSEGDKILVVTQQVFETFSREWIFQALAKTKKLKEIKKIFKEKKEILQEIFGAGLLIIPEKKGILSKKIYLPKIPRIPFPRVVGGWRPRSLAPFWRKNLIRILILVILLLLGYLIFR